MTRSVLINRIGELVTNAPGAADAADGAAEPEAGPGRFAAINDAAVVIEGDRIAWTGPSSRAPAADESVDAGGRAVLQGGGGWLMACWHSGCGLGNVAGPQIDSLGLAHA